MASTKEIRTRMKSVEQTLKITNAMYLIASSNLRKAKGRAGESRRQQVDTVTHGGNLSEISKSARQT